jgi:hypothetical protein
MPILTPMTLCNCITNTSVVCAKVWLQHENDSTPALVPMAVPPIGYQVPEPSILVVPTQPPVSIWTPLLRTCQAHDTRAQKTFLCIVLFSFFFIYYTDKSDLVSRGDRTAPLVRELD